MNGETAAVSATGSQINVGASKNTYTIEWGTAEATNYTVTENLGTLTVTAAPVTITADSGEKVYDGQPLTKNSYTYTALATDDKIESVTITGSQTDVGTGDNKPSGALIRNTYGEDVTDNYEIKFVNGKLEVTPAPDDDPIGPEIGGGEVVVLDISASMIVENQTLYPLDNGTKEKLKETNADLWLPEDAPGRVTIDAGKLKFSLGPAMKIGVTGLKSGQKLTVNVDGSITYQKSRIRHKEALRAAFRRAASDNEEMEIISGEEYVVLEDCDLILTIHTEDGPVVIESIYVEDAPTTIESIRQDADDSDNWYDLQGRKLDSRPSKKGLYIHNGKTLFVK